MFIMVVLTVVAATNSTPANAGAGANMTAGLKRSLAESFLKRVWLIRPLHFSLVLQSFNLVSLSCIYRDDSIRLL